MSYRLPVFNQSARITSDYVDPQTGPTWSAQLQVQKFVPSKVFVHAAATTWYWSPIIVQWRFEPVSFFALYAKQDIPGWSLSFLAHRIGGDDVYYRVHVWEIIHQGFPNEYPAVWAILCDPIGRPLFPGSANDNFYPPGDVPNDMGPIP